MEKKQFTILVEGNVGSGKTTLLRMIRDRIKSDNVKVFIEPIDQWRNFLGFNVLKEYYDNFKGWAMKFQLLALLTIGDRFNELSEINIMERSVISSLEIFAKRLSENGYLDKVEIGLLEKTRAMISKEFNPDLIIYNKTTPEVSMERIQVRARVDDLEQLTPELIQTFHDKHTELFSQEFLEWNGVQIPIYTFESPLGLDKIPPMLEELLKKIEQSFNIKIL